MGSKFQGVFRDSAGNAVASPAVTVYKAGTSTPAATSTLSDLSDTAPNPRTGGLNGQWEIFVPPGDYRLTGPGTYDEDYVRAASLPTCVNVLDYGADPTGAADSTAAFTAAYAALPATGGVIFAPPGTYKISTLVISKAGVTLVGAGWGATRLTTTATTGNVVHFGNTAAAYSPGGGIRDLSILSSVTRTSGFAISVDGCETGAIERVKIDTTGGGGMVFGASAASLSSLWFVRACDIELHGAFTGISLQGNNDRFISQCWIRGDETAGSKGIDVANSNGDWFTDVECVLCETGVDISPASGKVANWLNFTNVLADQNTLYGFRVAGAVSAKGLVFNNCWASSNGENSINARGFLLSLVSGCVISAPRVLRNGGHGIEVSSGAGGLSISGGLVVANSNQSSGTAHGIAIGNGTSGFRILGVRSGTTAALPTSQGYGILIGTGCDNFIVKDNDLRVNVTGGLNNGSGTAATRIVGDNLA